MTHTTRLLLSLSLLSISPVGPAQASAQNVETEGYVDAGNGVQLYYRMLGTGGGDPVIRIHLGLEQLTLLGHSWGAAPAALYAMQYPQRVRRMVLVGTIPFRGSELGAVFQKMAADRDSVTQRRMDELARIREANPSDLSACREYYSLWFTPFFPGGRAPAAMKGDVCAGSPESLRNKPFVDRFTFASLGDWDWTTSLRNATAPTLIIQGELDPLPLESARKWVTAMPNARILELPGIGHFPYVEAPDVFFPAVNRFLQGEWPEGATR